MGIITKISLRNLVRQRKRNIPLGICIALSMCILIVVFAYTSGITDILFNKVMTYAFGHIRVEMTENTSQMRQVIRDLDRFEKAAREVIPGIGEMYGEVNAFARCLGNGKSTSLTLVGLDLENEYENFANQLKVVEGDPKDVFLNPAEDALALYKQAADKLDVHVGDVVRVRLNTVSGQVQSAQLTVRVIAKADNAFMAMAAFMRQDKLRGLLGMRKQEATGLIINMKNLENPAVVIEKANKLHDILKPGTAGITAVLTAGRQNGQAGEPAAGNNSGAGSKTTAGGGPAAQANLFALKTDAEAKTLYESRLKLTAGDIASFKDIEDGVLLSEKTAADLRVKPGDTIGFTYHTRFENQARSDTLKVVGLFQPAAETQGAAFVNEEVFYKHYFKDLPLEEPVFDQNDPLAPALVPQYKLLERTPDTDSSMKKMQEVRKGDWKGAVVDVATMYETASMIINLQYVLNFIAMAAILILFIVILIGIVNTLRMTIRERTREIGTNRAIGMQRNDLINSFVGEILLLAVISCAVGLLAAFGLMQLLHLIRFDLSDNPLSILFIDGRLHFVPRISLIFLSFYVISAICFCVAFFPSRRASRMSAADALRHYE
jgi:ABC-type lipoprotein release transport system permease subunit